MCGIAGIIDYSLETEQRRPQLHRMVEQLDARGPDAKGFFETENLSLGHTRLKILDLSDRAAQPMRGFDDTLVLVFNGEIYNFPELAAELTAAGYELSGDSDTEVILKGYHCWGQEVFARLNGMFAIALYDSAEGQLVLARDRVGKKPLFYTQDGSRFLFASTLSSLASVSSNLRLDPSAVLEYLSTGYVSFSKSVFENVTQVLPAQILTIPMSTDGLGALKESHFWDLPVPTQIQDSFDEATERLGSTLDEAVRQRLISDRPLGLFLSGGLDSAVIGSLVRRHKKEQMHAFCCAFAESEYSELPEAQRSAEELGLTLHTVLCPQADRASIQEVIAGMGMPLGDSSYFPMHYLCKAAKEKVAVVLSGDGADELLAGYDTYVATKLSQNPLLNNALTRFVFSIAQGVLAVSDKKMGFEYRLAAFRRALRYPFPARHYMWRMMLERPRLRRVLGGACQEQSEELLPQESFRALRKKFEGASDLVMARAIDFHTWLPGDILPKVDLSSMAHGLEVRSPFLDYRIVEMCASFPDAFARKGRVGKRILRNFAKGLVPAHVRSGAKQGFNAPVPQWFRGELGECARVTFSKADELSQGLLKTAPLLELLEDHQQRKIDAGYFLWAVLVLLLWLETHTPPA